jgi:hypothetical protein
VFERIHELDETTNEFQTVTQDLQYTPVVYKVVAIHIYPGVSRTPELEIWYSHRFERKARHTMPN